jgi:hypothetical protein
MHWGKTREFHRAFKLKLLNININQFWKRPFSETFLNSEAHSFLFRNLEAVKVSEIGSHNIQNQIGIWNTDIGRFLNLSPDGNTVQRYKVNNNAGALRKRVLLTNAAKKFHRPRKYLAYKCFHLVISWEIFRCPYFICRFGFECYGFRFRKPSQLPNLDSVSEKGSYGLPNSETFPKKDVSRTEIDR